MIILNFFFEKAHAAQAIAQSASAPWLDDLNPTPFGTDIPSLMNSVANRFLWFLGALAIVGLIIAGGQYILAFGDPTKTINAKRSIFWIITGIIVVMALAAILMLIQNLLSTKVPT